MPRFISFSGKDKSDEKDTQESLQVCIGLTSDTYDLSDQPSDVSKYMLETMKCAYDDLCHCRY